MGSDQKQTIAANVVHALIVRREGEIICKELQGKVMNSHIPKTGYGAPGNYILDAQNFPDGQCSMSDIWGRA